MFDSAAVFDMSQKTTHLQTSDSEKATSVLTYASNSKRCRLGVNSLTKPANLHI